MNLLLIGNQRGALLLCAVGLAAAACGPGPTPRPTADQTASVPIGSPSSTVAAPGDVWTRIELPGAGGFFTDVASTPLGLVIVGTGGAAAEIPVAWVSVDGISWDVVQLPGAGFPSDLVLWDAQLVAYGGGQTNRCAHPDALDTWLRTPDGAWHEAPWDPIFCAGGLAYAAPAADHVVMAGLGTGDVAYVWTSDDGLSWTDVAFPRGVGAPRAVGSLLGTDVVMGSSFETGNAWVSRNPDGVHWSAPEPLVVPSASEVLGLVTVDGHFLAILRTDQGTFGALRSEDGVTWESAESVGLDPNLGAIIVAVEGGLVGISGDDIGPRLWASADGTSWRSVAVPSDVGASGSLSGIAVSQGKVYLVGQAATEEEAGAAAWVGPAALIAP